jgi:hypothetical protein
VLLFCVLAGTVRCEFGDGMTPPCQVSAHFGNMFDERPLNLFGTRNTVAGVAGGACAVLFYMRVLYQPAAAAVSCGDGEGGNGDGVKDAT